MTRVEALEPGDESPSRGFLQSAFWATFKEGFGWRGLAFRYSLDPSYGSGEPSGQVRVLLRHLAGPLCFAYVPGGPEIECPPASRSRLLFDLARALRPWLPRSCLFVRFDPPWFETEEETGADGSPAPPDGKGRSVPSRPAFDAPLVKASSDVQPPDSVLLDLRPSEESILASMKPKWRYNIRLAEKKAVIVEEAGSGGLDDFYRLYEETARRDGIAIHPRRYYEGLFEVCRTATGAVRPDLRLWLARHEGQTIAAIVTLYYGKQAVYLYGASSDSKRSLMPAYALQWAALRAARSANCESYDFYGIPPVDDPTHPMAGLYRFKTGFGGFVAHYAGSWDLPLNGPLYALWRRAEALRTWWFKVALKRIAR